MSIHFQSKVSSGNLNQIESSKTETTDKLGKIKDTFVSLGKGICKIGRGIKEFFKSQRTSLKARVAEHKEARALARREPGTKEQLALRKATPQELRQGYLESDKQKAIREKGKFDPPSIHEASNMRKKFAEAVTGKGGKIIDSQLPKAMDNFKLLLEANLAKGEINPNTILRANTPDTAFQTSFFRNIGSTWATAMLTDTIQDIREAGKVEVEPAKLKGTEEENEKMKSESLEKLGLMYQNLLNRVMNSAGDVPQEMCDVCKHIHDTILEKGGSPKAARDGASAAMILRLLNPILVAPHVAPDVGSLLPPNQTLSKEETRTALLLSKILQNQANNILTFVDKTPFLSPLDGILGKNAEDYNQFIQDVIDRGR